MTDGLRLANNPFWPKKSSVLLTLGSFSSKLSSFSRKLHSFSSELGSFWRKLGSFLSKLGSFSRKLGSFSSKLGSFLSKLGSFSRKLSSFSRKLGSFSYKLGSFLSAWKRANGSRKRKIVTVGRLPRGPNRRFLTSFKIFADSANYCPSTICRGQKNFFKHA